MRESNIIFDKKALILTFKDSKTTKTLNLNHDQIARIVLSKCSERRFLIKMPSEKIEIFAINRVLPLVYTKSKEKAFFNEYKARLIRFAKEYRINLVNNLES